MSDQEATPEAEAQDVTDAAESAINWEQRYNDLRPQYDRAQNEVARLNDPEHRQELFNQLANEYGYEIEADVPDETYDDPYLQLQAEMQQMRDQFQNYTQAQQHQQQVAIAEAYADNRLDELNVADNRKRDWIISRATAMPAIQYEGHVVPDIEAAYTEYQELVKSEQQAWAQSKQAPHVASAGQENTGVPAWSDDSRERAEQRQQHMLEQLHLRNQ